MQPAQYLRNFSPAFSIANTSTFHTNLQPSNFTPTPTNQPLRLRPLKHAHAPQNHTHRLSTTIKMRSVIATFLAAAIMALGVSAVSPALTLPPLLTHPIR